MESTAHFGDAWHFPRAAELGKSEKSQKRNFKFLTIGERLTISEHGYCNRAIFCKNNFATEQNVRRLFI